MRVGLLISSSENPVNAKFAAYIGQKDPLNPEAWMQENVPTGGRTATGGTALSVYGTKEVRTLEVVAIGAF